MNGPGILCPISILAGLLGLFLTYRFRSWLRRLFTIKSDSGASFIVLQEVVEPQVQRIIQVKDQKRHGSENGPSSEDPKEPPGASAP
jgi:hypothetical protein